MTKKIMKNFITQIKKKTSGIIWTLISTGVILLLLGLLIVWTDFFLRLVMGLLVMVIAYAFFYGAYKLWSLKKDIEKFFKL